MEELEGVLDGADAGGPGAEEETAPPRGIRSCGVAATDTADTLPPPAGPPAPREMAFRKSISAPFRTTSHCLFSIELKHKLYFRWSALFPPVVRVLQ